jgi:hypothetical protein
MKKITIFQENIAPVTVEDDDNLSNEEYARKIASLLENNNITMLHTSSCSVVLRPAKTYSFVISETKTPTKKIKQPIKKKETTKKTEEHEDIIHD